MRDIEIQGLGLIASDDKVRIRAFQAVNVLELDDVEQLAAWLNGWLDRNDKMKYIESERYLLSQDQLGDSIRLGLGLRKAYKCVAISKGLDGIWRVDFEIWEDDADETNNAR